jgi:hypothetical protein
VALATDNSASAHLCRTHTTNPQTERTWVGSCTFFRRPDPAIFVAGNLAEMLAAEPDIPIDAAYWQLDDAIEAGEVSPTDLAGFPGDLYAATAKAVGLLRQHRAYHAWAVRTLVARCKISERLANRRWREVFRSA